MIMKWYVPLASGSEGMAGNSATVSATPSNTIPALKLPKYLLEICPTLQTTATTPSPALSIFPVRFH